VQVTQQKVPDDIESPRPINNLELGRIVSFRHPMSVRRVPSPPILDPSQSGPDFWVVRRAQWLTPPAGSKQDPVARNDHQIKRLVELLDEPGAAENDAYWFGGVQRVWKGLISSHPVKHPLPLRTVVGRLRFLCEHDLIVVDQGTIYWLD
jgi:hypothetical protein